MIEAEQQLITNFHLYPSAGDEDWRYVYATAEIRVLESQLLSRASFLEMANSENFAQAVEFLSSTEYALTSSGQTIDELEKILLKKRADTRSLFCKLMLDEHITELFKSRDDFANLRLALRRKLTEKPINDDYSNDGLISSSEFEDIFEQENYSPLPLYMKEAIEAAVLAYYQNKDVRQIDYAIDNYQSEYQLQTATKLKNIFLLELFRMQIDLANIRTMLRLKLTESEFTDVFLQGGYISIDRFKHALGLSSEAIGPLFAATPYHQVVEPGVHYFMENNSFLKMEQHCEQHIAGYLKSTMQITTGPQPVIAYLLLKEHEIRTVRLIMTAKNNNLDTRLILDRIGE